MIYPPSDAIALDGGTLLTLCASGYLADITTAMGRRFVIAERVQKAGLSIRALGAGEDAGVSAREPIDCVALAACGLLSIIPTSHAELIAFVRLAPVVGDDLVAATIVLAAHHGCDIAIDGGKAVQMARLYAPRSKRYSTLDVVQPWAEGRRTPAGDVRAAFVAMHKRSNVLSPRGDPSVLTDPLRIWADNIHESPSPPTPSGP